MYICPTLLFNSKTNIFHHKQRFGNLQATFASSKDTAIHPGTQSLFHSAPPSPWPFARLRCCSACKSCPALPCGAPPIEERLSKHATRPHGFGADHLPSFIISILLPDRLDFLRVLFPEGRRVRASFVFFLLSLPSFIVLRLVETRVILHRTLGGNWLLYLSISNDAKPENS